MKMSTLGGELEFLPWNSAQLEEPDQGFFDQVVRTRRAGSDADDCRAWRQPEMGNDFALLVQIVMFDLILGNEPRSVQNKIGRQLFLAHFREVRRVRAVVTADDEKQIHFHV